MNKCEIEDMMETLELYNCKYFSDEELSKLSQSLFWEAQGKYEECCRLENEAEQIKKYIEYRKRPEPNQ